MLTLMLVSLVKTRLYAIFITSTESLYFLVKGTVSRRKRVYCDQRTVQSPEGPSKSFHAKSRDGFSHLFGMSQLSSQQLDKCGTENVVCITLLNTSFQQSLTSAVEKMIEAKLRLDKFGFNSTETTATSGIEEKHLSDKLTILVNDITIAMKKLNYASYREKVYKKDPRSRYTYSFKCESRAFVNTLATNEQFKSRL